MTATEELRRLLDERGVEWRERQWGAKHSVTTFWHARGVQWHYRENRFGELRLHADRLTPEQAIEAWNTRYERTCHKCNPGEVDWFVCSECGCQCAGDQYGELPKYCANCGAKVVS